MIGRVSALGLYWLKEKLQAANNHPCQSIGQRSYFRRRIPSLHRNFNLILANSFLGVCFWTEMALVAQKRKLMLMG